MISPNSDNNKKLLVMNLGTITVNNKKLISNKSISIILDIYINLLIESNGGYNIYRECYYIHLSNM